MEIPIIPILGQSGEPGDKSKGALSFRVGETVRAVVTQSAADGSVLLRMKNSLVEARTDLALTAGQVLFLKVGSSGDEIQLRVASGQAAADAALSDALFTTLAGLKNLPPAAADIAQLVAFLKGLPQAIKMQLPEFCALEKLLLPMDKLDGKLVEKAVMDSGVLFETKLRLIAEKNAFNGTEMLPGTAFPDNDLKGTLLKMKQSLADNAGMGALVEGDSNRQINRTLDRLIGAIEYQQVQSKLGESLQLFLPMIWEELRDEWIKFKKTGRPLEDPSYSCTINLDFENQGKLRSQLILQGDRIHVNIQSDHKAFAELLREQSELLTEQFKQAGLALGALTITVRDTLDFKQETPERLDIRI